MMTRSPSVRTLFGWLDEQKIIWALGASSVLYYNGHPVEPGDIDLFVDLEAYEKVYAHLSNIGVEQVKEDAHDIYNTQGFATFEVGNVEVDLIAGFYVRHDAGEYQTVFDRLSIDQRIEEDGQGINVMALEDWYVLYQLIPGREEKVLTVERMLGRKKTLRQDLLKRALDGVLPEEIRTSIERMIS